MSKECKRARNAVVLTFLILIVLLVIAVMVWGIGEGLAEHIQRKDKK